METCKLSLHWRSQCHNLCLHNSGRYAASLHCDMNDCELLESAERTSGEANAPGWQADSLTSGVLIVLVLMAVQRTIGFVRSLLFCRWLDLD